MMVDDAYLTVGWWLAGGEVNSSERWTINGQSFQWLLMIYGHVSLNFMVVNCHSSLFLIIKHPFHAKVINQGQLYSPLIVNGHSSLWLMMNVHSSSWFVVAHDVQWSFIPLAELLFIHPTWFSWSVGIHHYSSTNQSSLVVVIHH